MRGYEIHCKVEGCASGTIRAKNKKEALKLAKKNINLMLEFADLELDATESVEILDVVPI